MKVWFKNNVIKPQLDAGIRFDKVQATVTYYNKTKIRSDLDNWCIIPMKFSLDALKEFWVLEDDSYEYVKRIVFIYWKHDPKNPRVEITIESLEN